MHRIIRQALLLHLIKLISSSYLSSITPTLVPLAASLPPIYRMTVENAFKSYNLICSIRSGIVAPHFESLCIPLIRPFVFTPFKIESPNNLLFTVLFLWWSLWRISRSRNCFFFPLLIITGIFCGVSIAVF